MTLVSGDYVRVSCNFELGDGTLYQNIYTYTRDGVDVVSDATTVAQFKARMEAIYGTLTSQVKNNVVSKLCFVDQIAWTIDEWKVVKNIGVFTPTFTPTPVEDSLPFQSSPFVIFKTTRPKSVGKKFLFPFTELMQANSILVAGAVTAMVAYGVQVLSDLALGGDATMIPGIVRTGVDQWLSFQVAVVNDVLGTQRRRRPGVGA